MDSFLTGSPDNVAHLLGRDDFKLLKYDVTNFVYVKEDVDLVLHFACPASPRDYLRHPHSHHEGGLHGHPQHLGFGQGQGGSLCVGFYFGGLW